MPRARPRELFPTDGPLAPGELIGRAVDVSAVAEQLRVGINVILASPRRTGKTTVCDSALASLGGEGGEEFYVAKLDLWSTDDIGQMADALIMSSMGNRPALSRALRAMRNAGRTLYENVGLTLTPKLLSAGAIDGLDIDINLLPRLRADPVAHLDFALALPQRIASADGKPLVLYIDEFQDVERIGESFRREWAAVLKRKMRTAFQRSPDVSFLFAGSLEHMMTHIFGASDEPFFHFGAFHHLAPITPEEWREGLTARFSRDSTRIEPAALDLIVDKGGTHPRATMLLAQRAHLASITGGTSHITSDLAAVAYEDCMLAESSRHEAFVDRIRNLGGKAVNRLTLRTIAIIASGGKPYAGVARGQQPNQARALDALRDAGFIEPAGKQGWRVIDPLFAEYLRRTHSSAQQP